MSAPKKVKEKKALDIVSALTKSKVKEKKALDIVHQNAIHVETVQKEKRCQKLYTEFSINPFQKLHVLPDKPMSGKLHEEVEEDPTFMELIHRANSEPTRKYTHTVTESQEIGWISTPLITSNRSDRRLNFSRQNTEITKYMAAAWRLKEQSRN